MTLMHAPSNNQQQFKPRLVLWPRGRFLFNTKFSGFSLHNCENSIELAFRFFYYHFHGQRSRIVKFEDWLRITNTKMGMSNEAAFAIFICTQRVVPIAGEPKLQNLESANFESKADLLGLVLVLALTGPTQLYTNFSRDTYGFLKANLHEFITLSLLCHYKLAELHVQSPHFDNLPHLPRVPRGSLTNLDPVFEGILREERTISTSTLVPTAFSDLVSSILIGDEDDQIDFNELLKLVRKSLQTDMFTLDECAKKRNTSRQPDNKDSQRNTRTLTSTQLAEHRKLTVRHWSHMELLVKSEYRGANLRIQQDSYMAGSIIFCLRALRTASIVSSVDCGPIVLGPVSELLILRDLRNVSVSAVCTRVQVENCHDLRLFLNSECAPIITSNCSEIQLAPYNVFYDGLYYELKYSKMELLEQNQWDHPVCIDSDSNNNKSINSNCFGPMEEDRFYLQSNPFSQTFTTNFYKLFMQTIPSSYLNNFLKRRTVAQTWISRNPEHKLIGLSELDQNYLLRRIDQPNE